MGKEQGMNTPYKDLISVIVPVYKVERYLCRCVDSIIAQTYTNLQIILVDDGSPDGSGAICDDYAAKDSRITVIHKKNGGLSDARNEGLVAACGSYIGFVDSDDYIAVDMYEKLYKAIVACNADMSVCNFRYVDENGNNIEERNIALPVKDEVIDGITALTRTLDDKGWYYVTAWNRLYSRKLLQSIYFPDGKLHEDEFIVHRIYSKADKVACVADACYMYVQRGGSIMQTGYGIRNLDAVEALEQRFEFCVNLPEMSDYILRLSQRIYSMLVEAGIKLDMHNAGCRQRYKELKKTYIKQCRQIKKLFTLRQWIIDVVVFEIFPAINMAVFKRL